MSDRMIKKNKKNKNGGWVITDKLKHRMNVFRASLVNNDMRDSLSVKH